VPVRRTVQGLFQARGGLGRVYFWGVELAEPPPPQAVGSAMVKDAFDLGVNAGGKTLVPRSAPRQYDAGPLGGQVWCQTFNEARRLPRRRIPANRWRPSSCSPVS
jgi:hypothetical protein